MLEDPPDLSECLVRVFALTAPGQEMTTVPWALQVMHCG